MIPVPTGSAPKLGQTILTEEQIRESVRSLARQIEDAYLPGGFGIVPILPQSITLAHDLLKLIRIPVRVFGASVFAESLGDKDGLSYFRLSGKIESHQDLPEKVLVVTAVAGSSIDFINYTCGNIRAMPSVKNVKSCVLLQMADCDSEELPFDFVGQRVAEPTQDLVGYGLGYAGYHTQLPYIAALRND